MNKEIVEKCTVDLPIGNLKAGELFVVADNALRAKIDFNLFAAGDFVAMSPEVDLLDFLFEQELVSALTDETQEAIEKEWTELSMDEQQRRIFEPSEGFPRTAALLHMQKYLPGADKVLNPAQYLTIACHLGFEIFEGMTIYNRIINMPDELRANKQYLRDFVIRINSVKVANKEKALLESRGYVVNGVFAESENGLNFAFTSGFHMVNDSGFNFFACMSKMPCSVHGAMIESMIALYKEGKDIFEVTTGHGKLRTGADLRLKCIKADWAEVYRHDMHLRTGDNGGDLIQILIPDENNVLPDEDGYNQADLRQPLCISTN